MAIVQVPITKSGGLIELDTDKIPTEVYEAALLEGLKSLANKGMSKITTKGLEGDDLAKAKAAAQTKGEANRDAIMDGSIKLPGRKAKSKVPGEVMTEARRLAKNLIKDEMKKAGIRLKDVDAKDITKAANALLDGNAELIAEARENVEARKASKQTGKISLASVLPDFDTLVAKGKEAKAQQVERGKQLSAKQAGMTAKRAKKPAAGATAH